jgi:hypothetical protein
MRCLTNPGDGVMLASGEFVVPSVIQVKNCATVIAEYLEIQPEVNSYLLQEFFTRSSYG